MSPQRQQQQQWMFPEEDEFEDPFAASNEKDKKTRMMMSMMKPQYESHHGNGHNHGHSKKDTATPKTSLTHSTMTPMGSDWEINAQGDTEEASLGKSSVGNAPKPPVSMIRVASPLPVMTRKDMNESLGKKTAPPPKSSPKKPFSNPASSMGRTAARQQKVDLEKRVAEAAEEVDGDPSPLKSDMLKSFLEKAGQDEKLASEMAVAFEAFLLQHQQG